MKKILPFLLLLLLLMFFCAINHSDESKIVNFTAAHDKSGDHLYGTLGNEEQIRAIESAFAGTKAVNLESDFKVEKELVDPGGVEIAQRLLPIVASQYTESNVTYIDNHFTVRGKAKSKEAMDRVASILTDANISTKDLSVLDNEYIAKLKAEQEAAKKAEEMRVARAAQRAKEQAKAAEAARVAEAKKAQEAAKLKAEQEAKKRAILEAKKAAQEAERKAQEEAEQKAKEAELKAKQEAEQKAKEAELKAKQEAELKAKKEAEKAAKAEADKLAAEQAAQAAQARAKAQKSIAEFLQKEIIEFEVGKSVLTSRGLATADKLVLILKTYPDVNIEIGGHTDSDGSAQFNQKLSQGRVDAVKAELVKEGIKAERITAKGYGERKPLVPNTTRANKQKNRRVEIIVLGE